jgi:hypothetical protein
MFSSYVIIYETTLSPLYQVNNANQYFTRAKGNATQPPFHHITTSLAY